MWKNYIPYVFLVEMSNNIADLDNNLAVSQKKINIPLLQNPAFTLGYLLPKKKKKQKTCIHIFSCKNSQMFTAILFVIAKNWQIFDERLSKPTN